MIFEDDIENALVTLREGGIILYPTDTIWGLGCDATNQEAVEKIFKIKSRDESKGLLILVNGENMVERYVKEIPEVAYELISVSDTPLTIIYPSGKNLAPGVCSPDSSVGIRICNDVFCNELISRFRKPIVSTSANHTGKPSPGNYTEIEKSVINKVDYVVKYRQNDRKKSTASPVIRVDTDGTIKILRK